MKYLREYLAEHFSNVLERAKFNMNDLTIRMGALIQPKIAQEYFINEPKALVEIDLVYSYLYKFSFERLQDFLNDPYMVLLFYRMLEEKCTQAPVNANKLKMLAEDEAQLLMLQHSCFAKRFPNYDGNALIKALEARITSLKSLQKAQAKKPDTEI